MAFVTEARQLLGNMPQGTANHAILEYLINNALGAGNAKAWDAIEAHSAGISIGVDKWIFNKGF
jgi:hypothetical protein